MSKIILTVLFVVFYFEVNCQDYHVLQVKGVVKNSKGIPLKTHDILKSNEKVSFSSANDVVAVVSPKTGRFILKPVASQSESELVAYVKNAITPGVKKLSTRSGVLSNVVDFQVFFQSEVLLLNSLRLHNNAVNFPVTDNSFFFIRYRLNNEEINKRLEYDGDTLLIKRSELFMVDNSPIDPAKVEGMELYYLRDSKIQMLSPLKFVLADEKQVMTEVMLLWSKQSMLSREQKDDEALAYLNEFYGKIDSWNFSVWSRSFID